MSDTITLEERANLRELAQMVTPGPYFADGFDVQDGDDTVVARCNGDINDLQEDTQESLAHFIAAACNMAPRLLDALEAAEARALTWTTEPPKVPGWYWFSVCKGHAVCIPVGTDGKAKLAKDHFTDAELLGGQWAGPITPPRE